MCATRIGVVGARGRGAFLAMMYHRPPRAEVVAAADPDPQAFDFHRERFEQAGCQPRRYPAADEMLEKESLDWVFVASPDRTHFDLGAKALRAGCHAFIEKPMCQSLGQADALCRLSEETGRHIVVGCELRYSLPVQRFREILRGGSIGRIVHGYCVDSVGVGYTFFLRNYRWKRHGPGLLMQKGVHSLDLLNDFVDSEPVRVYASGGLDFFGQDPDARGKHCRDCGEKETCPFSAFTVPSWRGEFRDRGEQALDHCVHGSDADVEDNTIAVADYANGVRLSYSEVHFSPEYQRAFHFFGTEGRASLVVQQRPAEFARIETLRLSAQAPDVEEPGIGAGGHWGADDLMRDAFLDAVGRGESILPGAREGRAAVAFAEAATKSIETGMPVEIPRGTAGSRSREATGA